jgi:N-methylhydantoinase A
MANGQWRAGVDIGGTFTDLLLVDEESGRFRVGKVLTTESEPAAGVRGALTGELESGDLSADSLGTLVHGTTLVTNAVIERKGAISALLITEGFRDTLLIGREHRYDMYDARLEKPEPLGSWPIRRREVSSTAEATARSRHSREASPRPNQALVGVDFDEVPVLALHRASGGCGWR